MPRLLAMVSRQSGTEFCMLDGEYSWLRRSGFLVLHLHRRFAARVLRSEAPRRQTALRDEVHSALDGNAKDGAVLIDPAAAVELCLFGRLELLEVRRRIRLQLRGRRNDAGL